MLFGRHSFEIVRFIYDSVKTGLCKKYHDIPILQCYFMPIIKLIHEFFFFNLLIHEFFFINLELNELNAIFTNLFMTLKTKPQIHQFTNLKCCKKAREPSKILFNGVLFLIYYFEKYSQPCFFSLKALKHILQHFKFVNW